MKEKFCECAGAGSETFAALLDDTAAAFFGGLSRLADDKLKLLVEGGKWQGCWSQNYFGMCCAAPLLSGKLLDYHENTLEAFFDLQGDGRRTDMKGFTAPEGALPEYLALWNGFPEPRYKNDESSGLAAEFDFWVEGTAASVISLCDLLLARRDREKTARYLPGIEKALQWLLSRKDPRTGLLKVGPAGTLIERAYGATFRREGAADPGLPAGSAVNTVRALRLAAELELMAGREEPAVRYRREAAELTKAVELLVEEDSYLINYLDADGLRHGVLGAERFGYFEGTANTDGAAWGILSPGRARRALTKLKNLSPTPLAVSVWPVHDDAHYSYQKNDPAYGGAGSHWNGAAWFSSQARYLLGLLRYGFFEEAQAVGEAMLAVHDTGTMRDVMDDYGRRAPGGNNPEKSGTFYIDGFGAFAGLLRGLFEAEYLASEIALAPHLPENITSYVQRVPLFWGGKRIFPRVTGSGNAVRGIRVNGKPCAPERREGRFLFGWEKLSETAEIEFLREPPRA